MAVSVNQSGTWKGLVNAQVNQAGVWTQTKNVYVNKAGTWTIAWAYEVKVTLASQSTSVNLRSLFDAATWASATPKRVVVPAGVTIGANNFLGAIYLDAGTAWGGTLTVDILGTLYGIGGTTSANSGEGGAGIGSSITGASGQRITVNNSGGIYAGGGAGGKGGTGGGGSYSYVSYDSGYVLYGGYSYWMFNQYSNEVTIIFNGGMVYDGYPGDVGTLWVGSDLYYRGGSGGGNNYEVRKTSYATAYTSGGAGGAGGRGQGSDGAASAGAGGAAGGTNAGAGGQGGTGGAWGAQGSTGNTGAAGNNGGGAAGASGGAGGRYAYGYLIFNNTGTVAGRSAII